MEPIGITAQRLLKNWSSARQKEDILKQGFKKLFTPKERRHIKQYSLRQGRIIVSVDSSSWLYLLNLKKEQLLKNINQALGSKQAITEIRLRLDRDEAQNQHKNQNQNKSKRKT